MSYNMSNDMSTRRLTFNIPKEQLNRMMIVAAHHGIHTYTKAIRQAVELWIVVMNNRYEIEDALQNGNVATLEKFTRAIEPKEKIE